LKEEYKILHSLVLAGSPGYGYEALQYAGDNILELGFVSEEEKWQLLSGADIFLFPSFYEGFGLPILEAQLAGAPIITSLNSCLPEVSGEGAMFVNPQNSDQIAEVAKRIIDDKALRDRLIQLGRENVKRFNWGRCALQTLRVLNNI
jgi:glycosyltransferase involved in cell wall biosynthesis